jgi:hypothetical protein
VDHHRALGDLPDVRFNVTGSVLCAASIASAIMVVWS